jgi:hypothetical protein
MAFRFLALLFAVYSAPLPEAPAQQGEPIKLIISSVVANNNAVCAID